MYNKIITIGASRPQESNPFWGIQPKDPRLMAKGGLKEETVPMAFRIDEVKYAQIDLWAEAYGVSMTAFMNQMVDDYLAKCQTSIPFFGCKQRAMELFLDRISATLQKMKLDDILEKYHESSINQSFGLYKNILSYAPSKKEFRASLKEYKNNIAEIVKANYSRSNCPSPFANTLDLCIRITDDNTATVRDYRDETLRAEITDSESMSEEKIAHTIGGWQNANCWNDYALYIPIEKYFLVTPLLEEFESKYMVLNAKTPKCLMLESEDNEDDPELRAVQELAAVINRSSVKNVIANTAEFLKKVKVRVEDGVGDGSENL